MFDLEPELAELAADSAGVLHRAECHAAGVTDRRLWWLLESGRWQQLFPRVIATFSGPVPRESMLHAALKYAGSGAALSHATAAALFGLRSWPESVVVTVPYVRSCRPQPGLTIHRSRTLTAEVVHPALSPPRTRVERTVLDLVGEQRTVEAVLALVADAVRQRLTTTGRLRATIQASPRGRWRREVLTALPDVAAGAHSVLEIHDARLRRRHGLPAGKRQVRRERDGTEWLDVRILEFGVHIELDGRLGHEKAGERWRDMRRDNASVVAMLRHLRYGWADVLGRPCEVAIEQGLVLRQQGWTGRFRRCPSCPPRLPAGL